MTPDQHRFMGIVADAKEHSFLEIVKLGSILMHMQERHLERFFYDRICANNWVSRQHKSWSPRLDFYVLTDKGDKAYRMEQISRIMRGKSDAEAIRHFKYFNRKATGQWSAEHLGKKITEEDVIKSGYKARFSSEFEARLHESE